MITEAAAQTAMFGIYVFKVACVAASAYLVVNSHPIWAGVCLLVAIGSGGTIKEERKK